MNKVSHLIQSFRLGGLTRQELDMCLPEMRKRNAHTLNIMLPTIFVIALLLTIVALIPGSGEEGNLDLYTMFAVITAAEYIVFRLCFLKKDNNVIAIAYVFIVTLYFLGMYEAVYLGSESTSVVYCIFTVIVPVIVIDRPSRLAFVSIVMEVVLLILHSYAAPGLGDQFVVVNSLSSTFLGVICGYTIQKTKFSDIRNHLMLEVQRDTDMMTGSRSRVAYIRDLSMMSDTEISAGVIYADVNGLKRANDTMGHKAGDALIKDAFALLQRYFGEASDSIYRIGGDEFVVVSIGEKKTDFFSRLDALSKDKEKKEILSMGGVWYSNIEDVEAAIKEAEVLMYSDKAQYYKSHPENDRRTR